METGEETREVRILLHEDYEKGVSFSCQASNKGGGWQITSYTVDLASDPTAVQKDVIPAPNDPDGIELIRQTLERAFGKDLASHVFQILTRCCHDFGMHLVQPAGIGD